MKVNLKIVRRFRSKLEKEILKDYLKNNILDIDKLLDDFYGYVYIIVKNVVNIFITDEDIEEIISDVFLAIWKNKEKLSDTTVVKSYLAGITKNVIKNKYRNIKINFSISDYEESIVDTFDIEEISEIKEQDRIIHSTLQKLKIEEYKIFIMFYYEAKSIKEISKVLDLSTSNVKTILHRIRKIIKRNLENGGYGYGK